MCSYLGTCAHLPPPFPFRQTWIAQILHENFEDMSDDDVFLSNGGLTDGRVLCRVANAIAPGSVKMIHQDRSNNVSSEREKAQALPVSQKY